MSHRASHIFFSSVLGQSLCSYPEFSVFPRNLVPSCALCNTRKRDRILEENTDVRVFLHPCYDSIPDAEFLIVRARNEDDAVILSYRLIRPAGMTLSLRRRRECCSRCRKAGGRTKLRFSPVTEKFENMT